MKLIPVVYLGFTAMDRRFSSPMLPWIVSEIRKRDYCDKLSLGVEDGILQAYNQDFELQFSHRISHMTRFSQADLDACTFLYLLRDENEDLLYCYLFQAQKSIDVMHLIDEVLDPFITSSPFNPSAYDFLQSSKLWKIGSVSVGSFFHRIQENRLQHIFSQPGGHTFFIPVDSGIDKYKFSMIDKYVIFGHVIPHMVLFTRPTKKEFYFESLSNGDYIYILLAFVDDSGVLKVKSSTVLGDTTHPQGVQYAKIVKANIPVKNGVVHLISQPLVIFNRKLQPFPFWPIYQKISGDPTLDIVYEMGEKSGFNKIFLNDSLTFTYFIARDSSWNKISQNGLVPIEDTTTLLGRHLVISETPYSMEKLISLSRANNYTDFELNTLSGSLRISVQKIGDDYFIKWYNRYIKVHRPDYECTNGIVHVLDGPITKFKRIGTRVNIKGAMENQEEDGGGFWGSLKRFAESF